MLKAGAAFTVITPPVGTSLAGYFHDRFSTAVHDDLLARAIVLDDGKESAAIVCCDLVNFNLDIVRKTRALASSSTGIPEGSIFMCCTHTHTGPQINSGRVVQTNPDYLEGLPARIASAVVEAHKNQRTASLRLGEEQEDSIAFIRRFRMKGGGEAFNPGFQNPDIIGPSGTIDPQVNLLRVDEESGEPMALLGNYALHPDVLGGCEISGDWPGELCRILRANYNDKPVTLFAQGTCGNINHFDVSKPGPQRGWEKVEQIARVLAGKMMAASERSQPMESDSIRVKTRMLEIPFHPLTPELIERAREIRSKPDSNEFERAQASIIENYKREGKCAPIEIMAIRVGDAAIIGVPCEYFVEWGKEIKHWSPFKQTFVVELANGWFGYVATLQAYYRGGYEVTPVLSAQMVPEAGLRMADAAIELLFELAGQ